MESESVFAAHGMRRTLHEARRGNSAARRLVADVERMLASKVPAKWFIARSHVYRYLRNNDLTIKDHGDGKSPGAALYNYRQALRWGNLRLAYRIAKRLEDRQAANIKSPPTPIGPLAGIPVPHRYSFRKSLTGAADREVADTIKWFDGRGGRLQK